MKNGKIVEQGPFRAGFFTGAETSYTRYLLAAEPNPNPPRREPDHPVVKVGRQSKSGPSSAGLLPTSDISSGRWRQPRRAQWRDARRGRRNPVRQDHRGWRCCGSDFVRTCRSCFLRPEHQACASRPAARFPPRHARSCFRSFRRRVPRMVGGTSSPRASVASARAVVTRSDRRASSKALNDVGPRADHPVPLAHEFPAASGHVSRLRARVSGSLISACWTSRPARSTFLSGPMVRLLRELRAARPDLHVHLAQLSRGASLASHLIVMRSQWSRKARRRNLFKNPKSATPARCSAAAFRIGGCPVGRSNWK